MDIFTWSIPFVAEKITEMFYHILKPKNDEEISDEEDEPITGNSVKKNDVIFFFKITIKYRKIQIKLMIQIQGRRKKQMYFEIKLNSYQK